MYPKKKNYFEMQYRGKDAQNGVFRLRNKAWSE